VVRIIGGRWRGRRLPVAEGAQLRPSGDRVRETLFNWLAPVLPGLRCLDLFAGTGALGIEALSRGAASAWFVERDPRVAALLEAGLGRLAAANARVISADALRFLAGTPQPFDLVFLDPPFGAVDPGELCTLLRRGWLAADARVYLELPRTQAVPALPPGWAVLREKVAGQVRFALLRAAAAPTADVG
jgi:16S rRNA (guanine966-N2)-methyltransferase